MRLAVVGALLCTFLSVVARGFAVSKLHWPLRNGGGLRRSARPDDNCDCIHKTRVKESTHRRKSEQPAISFSRIKARLIGPPLRHTTRSHVLLRRQRLSTTTRATPLQIKKDNAEIFYEPVQYLYHHIPQNSNQEPLFYKSLYFPRLTPEMNGEDLKIGLFRRRNNGFEEQDIIANSQKSVNGIDLFLDIVISEIPTKDSQGLEELTKISKIDEAQKKLFDCLDFQLAQNNCNFIVPGDEVCEHSKNYCKDVDKIISENREYIQSYYSQRKYNPEKHSEVLRSQNKYELLKDEQNYREELESFIVLNHNILQEMRTQNMIKTLQSAFTKPVLEFLQQTGINKSANTNIDSFKNKYPNVLEFVKSERQNQILKDIHNQCKTVDTFIISSGNEKVFRSDSDQEHIVTLEDIGKLSDNTSIRTIHDILEDIQKSCLELENILFENEKLRQEIFNVNSEQSESAVTRPPLEYLPHRSGIVSYYEESTDSEISDSFAKGYIERYQGVNDKSAIDSDTQSTGINELLLGSVNSTNLFKNDSKDSVTIYHEITTTIPHYTNTIETSTYIHANSYDEDMNNTKTSTYEPTVYETMDWFQSVVEDTNVTPTYPTEEQTSMSTTMQWFQKFNSENILESNCTTLNCTMKMMAVLNNTFLSPRVPDMSDLIVVTENDHIKITQPDQEVTTQAIILNDAALFETDITPSTDTPYTSTINLIGQLDENNNDNSSTDSQMRNTGLYTVFTTPIDYRPQIKENNIVIPKVESHEWKNGSVLSRVDGFEHLPNNDFLNLTEAHDRTNGMDTNMNQSVSLQVISGKIIFVSNRHNIPLQFIQNTNGDIDLGIDGNYICKHLIDGFHDSVMLSILCNSTLSSQKIGYI